MSGWVDGTHLRSQKIVEKAVTFEFEALKSQISAVSISADCAFRLDTRTVQAHATIMPIIKESSIIKFR